MQISRKLAVELWNELVRHINDGGKSRIEWNRALIINKHRLGGVVDDVGKKQNEFVGKSKHGENMAGKTQFIAYLDQNLDLCFEKVDFSIAPEILSPRFQELLMWISGDTEMEADYV